ncbi:MAG: hypothetical protein E7649_00070 [Ruminococcaceae bacterium]|nr:hypothetical protein [Oscillospiraceae bacterium]
MFVLIDERASVEAITALRNKGFEPILMPPSPHLQTGVSSHTDMLVFMGFGRLFCHVSYYEQHKHIIDKICYASDLSLCLSDEKWSDKYPSDVLFNACLIGNTLICNEKSVSSLILDAARKDGCKVINVSQGYTQCSVCPVSDTAIITADKAIVKACQNCGFDVLLISEGHVYLPPYDFGFIGGASGLCGDTVYFCGNIDLHPDAASIKAFCQKHGKTVVSLSGGELFDVGSLFFI